MAPFLPKVLLVWIMDFKYENEMMGPAAAWLQDRGLAVKREFQTPWGLCDLVGCSLNRTSVKRRLALGQASHISSQLRVALLYSLPDVEEEEAASLEALNDGFGGFLDEAQIESELQRLVEGRFVRLTNEGGYQKCNGWIPLHKKIVALELKLSRISDVFHQAVGNLGFAQESYIGIPMATGRRLMSSSRLEAYKQKGIGILGIARDKCTVLLRASFDRNRPDAVLSAYCAERFLSLTVRDNST